MVVLDFASSLLLLTWLNRNFEFDMKLVLKLLLPGFVLVFASTSFIFITLYHSKAVLKY